MSERVLALAEITELERAYALGAPSLGRAAAALLARWRLPLRDEETFLRLAFLMSYREHEPEWLTGLTVELPPLAQVIAEHGGEDALRAVPSHRRTGSVCPNAAIPRARHARRRSAQQARTRSRRASA